MKLIRLTDDRYILDAGPEIRADQLEEIRHYWEDWWKETGTHPLAMVIGGSVIPLTYEDRREPDIESRLRRLEAHLHHTGLEKSSAPVYPPDEPRLSGIEQYQAESR